MSFAKAGEHHGIVIAALWALKVLWEVHNSHGVVIFAHLG